MPASKTPKTPKTPATPVLVMEEASASSGGQILLSQDQVAAVAATMAERPIGSKPMLIPLDLVEVTHNSPHDLLRAVRDLLPDSGARYPEGAADGTPAQAVLGTVTVRHDDGRKQVGFRWRKPTKAQEDLWRKGQVAPNAN